MFHQGDKSHTGDILTLVKVSIVNGSTKHNISTNIFMEVELGVFGDFSPYIIWTNYFLNGKYYGVNNTNLYHDKSVILLENTSFVSSSNSTKHIYLR